MNEHLFYIVLAYGFTAITLILSILWPLVKHNHLTKQKHEPKA